MPKRVQVGESVYHFPDDVLADYRKIANRFRLGLITPAAAGKAVDELLKKNLNRIGAITNVGPIPSCPHCGGKDIKANSNVGISVVRGDGELSHFCYDCLSHFDTPSMKG